MASSLQELFSQPKVTLTELAKIVEPEPTPEEKPEIEEEELKKPLTPEELEFREKCTVFVGNLPLNTKQWELKKFFKDCGEIVAVRFRSVPTKESKLPKRAAVILKQYSDAKDTMNAYVVFKDFDSIEKATNLNGNLFKEKHIRVNSADDTKHDYKNTVFVGNIPYNINEDELWTNFEKVGKVKSVRLVRDNKTHKSKGIAYIMFENKEDRTKAISEKVNINGRELRIKKATSKQKLEKKEKYREEKAKEFAEKRKPKIEPIPEKSKPEQKSENMPQKAKKPEDKKREEIRKQRKIERKMRKQRKEMGPEALKAQDKKANLKKPKYE